MQSKVSKLAVLLCGDLRLWSRAHPYIFDLAESRANSVDYFFVTWNETRDHWWPEDKSVNSIRPVTDEEITAPFTGRNLIKFLKIDQKQLPRYEITIYYQSWLAKIANHLKKRHEFENNFVYDQVIEVRPDIYVPVKNTQGPVVACGDFEYIIGSIYNNNTLHYPQINDFYSRSSSFGNDVISNRFFYKNPTEVDKFKNPFEHWPTRINNHWVLVDYLMYRRLLSAPDTFNECDNLKIIRPNFPEGDLRQYPLDRLTHYATAWYDWQWNSNDKVYKNE